jgi:hypothetical protein
MDTDPLLRSSGVDFYWLVSVSISVHQWLKEEARLDRVKGVLECADLAHSKFETFDPIFRESRRKIPVLSDADSR